MIKLYQKNQVRHALAWLAIYLVTSIVVINIGQELKISEQLSGFIPLSILSLIMFSYLKRTKIDKNIGLTKKFELSSSKMIFYIPLIAFALIPLFYEFNKELSIIEIIASLLMMLSVGFLEETIFRGLLFRGLQKVWKPVVVIVFLSLTFGFGHITSLLMGKDLALTLLQIANATIVGLMFLLVVISTNNLIVVIIIHGIYNFLVSISLIDSSSTSLLIINAAISILYSIYMIFYLKSYKKIIDNSLIK